MLRDLISPRNAKIHAPFTHEGWDVCGGEEDEREVVVLDQRDVKARFSPELDVGASQEVECGLLEAPLCERMSATMEFGLQSGW